MTNKITLKNDFHNTAITVPIINGYVAPQDCRLARHTLCPFEDCPCSCCALGVRGDQASPFKNGELVIAPLRNGGAMVYYQVGQPGTFQRGY